MSKLLARDQVAIQARIVETPRAPTIVDRSFELPRVLYGATVGLYLAFLAVMATGLASPGLLIPMAIFVILIVAGFGLPTIWVRMKPESRQGALQWQQFRRQGIATPTGRLAARDATVQVLILPALIFLWGIVAVTIAATV